MVIAAAAAVQALTASTAFAQNAVTPAPAGNATDVGPAQLRDFTLNGTVTRPAEPREQQPAPAAPPPATQAPRAQPSTTTQLPPARPPASTATVAPPQQGSATVELPAPTPSPALPPTGGELVEAPQVQEPVAGFTPEPAAMPDGTGILPWLLAAMLIGAGAAYYVFRVRPRAQLAGGGETTEYAVPEPAEQLPGAAAPASAPEPRARPAPSVGGGVVSARLRPWIEIEFTPERTIVEDERIAIDFAVTLYNSGSAPARDIRLEAAMFNASPDQDRQIATFFAQPSGSGGRIEVVAPFQRATVRSSVVVPRGEVRALLAEGRPLLVPMTALTAIYRWGSNNSGQTSASYLVGKQTNSDKLAPFRLDIGPRVFRGLAAREHQVRVRN